MNIQEVTAVGKYFEKNPEKLEKYDFPLQSAAERFTDVSALHRGKEKLAGIIKQAAEKWKILKNITIKGKNLISTWDGNGFEPSYYFRSAIRYNDSYDGFAKDQGTPEDPEQEKLLRTYYSAYRKDFLTLEKAEIDLQHHQDRLDVKQARRKGIHPESYEKILSLIKYYTGKSGRKIPKEAKDALQKATVVANELPRVIYRGMFYDGNKIKDKEKFLKKWSPGSKPGAKFSKPSSWSTSQSVAAQFMTAQDSVKNREDGFAVMLRYTITDPKNVIADLRNLPESRFWNQQEIILDPEVTDYEVLYLIPGNDDAALTRLQDKVGKPYAGAAGFSKRELLLQSYFDLPLLDIPANIKEKWRTYTNLTAKQVKDAEGIIGNYIPEYESLLENFQFPLYVLMNKSIGPLEFAFDKFIDKANAAVSIKRYIPSSTSVKNSLTPLMQKILGKEKVSTEDVGYYNHIIFDATVTLASTSGNKIDFVIKDINNMRVKDVKDAPKIQNALEKNTEIRKEYLNICRNDLAEWNATKSIAKFQI